MSNTDIQRAPTIIDIKPVIYGYIAYNDDPYYQRIEVGFVIRSTTKFDWIAFSHLGFKSRSKGKSGIRYSEGRYIAGDDLEPNTSALMQIKPFLICLVNVGDSFMQVNVRMPSHINCCKMIILQEGKQPRKPKEVDDFIEYEGIYYCTATINCLQTIRIEEIGEPI